MGFFDKVKKAFGLDTKPAQETPAQESESEEVGITPVPSSTESEESVGDLTQDVTSVSTEAVSLSVSATNSVTNQESESTHENSESLTEVFQTSSSEKSLEQVVKTQADTAGMDETSLHDMPSSLSLKASSTHEVEVETDEQPPVHQFEQGLAKSRTGFAAKLNAFMAKFRTVDEDFFEDLEDLLIESDVGFNTAMELSTLLRDEAKLENAKSTDQLKQVIVEKMVNLYGADGEQEDNQLQTNPDGLTVFLFVGVNGAGKTTTIGKLAARYHKQGKKVLLAAGDTFRAGAIEQLQVWGNRTGVPVVALGANTDPAAVVYEAVKRAQEQKVDFLLIDTAGRLQNKVNLMNELAKMKRIIQREIPAAPQEVLLVLDATTGQNALSQAKQFKETTDVSGIVLTKLDGSSKGGIAIAVRRELHIPVKLVGLGEQLEDLRDFIPEDYVYGLFKDFFTREDNLS